MTAAGGATGSPRCPFSTCASSPAASPPRWQLAGTKCTSTRPAVGTGCAPTTTSTFGYTWSAVVSTRPRKTCPGWLPQGTATGRSTETIMRIGRLEITRFRGFQSLVLAPRANVIIVGEPRAGRSDLIAALRRVLEPRSIQSRPSEWDIYRPSPDPPSPEAEEDDEPDVQMTSIELTHPAGSAGGDRAASAGSARTTESDDGRAGRRGRNRGRGTGHATALHSSK